MFNILATTEVTTISPAVCVSLFSIHDVQEPFTLLYPKQTKWLDNKIGRLAVINNYYLIDEAKHIQFTFIRQALFWINLK